MTGNDQLQLVRTRYGRLVRYKQLRPVHTNKNSYDLIQSETNNIKKLGPEHAGNDYIKAPVEEEYCIGFIKELIEVKNNTFEVDGFIRMRFSVSCVFPDREIFPLLESN